MRLALVACFGLVTAVGSLIACAPEEPPNPPATRNGTEDTEQSTGANLPAPSDTSKPQPSSSSGSSGSETPDATAALPNGPNSGVQQNKTLAQLSSSEKKQLCDWQAGINGGYGHTTTCEGGISMSGPKSQTACVQKLPSSCQATVGEVEACLKLDAQDPCAFALFKAPECEPVRNCSK